MAKKEFKLPSRTQQQFKDETDINQQINRWRKTGLMGQTTRRPIFGDFMALDFQQMMNSISDVEQNFASLPSRIRSRFKNDPYQLLRFVEDPANTEEAIKLRLLAPAPQTADEAWELAAQADEQKLLKDQRAAEAAAKALRLKEIAEAFGLAQKADEEANPNFRKPTTPEGG